MSETIELAPFLLPGRRRDSGPARECRLWFWLDGMEGKKMASIRRETVVDIGADQAWAALRTVAAAHELFAPVLTDGELHGETRRVRFANGMVVNERIVDVDEGMRRVAYSALDAPGLRYHHASMQVVDEGSNQCRFVWITDFLPADAGGTLAPLIEAGSAALKTNLEAGKPIASATQLA